MTLDDWIRAYRQGGFSALAPKERASVPHTPRALLDQAAVLRRENPATHGRADRPDRLGEERAGAV